MKSIRTRIFALLLTIIMCIGLLPATALAASEPHLLLGDHGATVTIANDYKTINYIVYQNDSTLYVSQSGAAFEELVEQYGTCTLTRVIQYADGKEETLTDVVVKSVKLSFSTPSNQQGRSFDGWHHANGDTFHYIVSEDTTIYLTETYTQETFTVSYDLDGLPGRVIFVASMVQSGQTVKLPSPPAWEGYTFLGWYSGIPSGRYLNNYSKWSNDRPVVSDMTLYAMWEPERMNGEKPSVVYNANGGTFSGGGRSVVTTTTSSLITVEKPDDPIREGYSFTGWYTKDGRTWDGFGTEIAYKLTLYAGWEPEGGYTVTFDLGAASVKAPKAQAVHAGNPIDMPDPPTLNGYRFLYWATEDGTVWRADDLVMGDMTLYAKWDNDRFSFSNSTNDFMKTEATTYQISGKYLKALQSGLTPEQWKSVKAQMDGVWGGSCLGMSILYALRSVGRIDPAFFQDNADLLYDLAAPVQSQTVFNLVNYYHLQWRRPEIKSILYNAESCVSGYYNQELVKALKATNQPVVLCFMFGRNFTVQELRDPATAIPAHAVVGLRCDEKTDGTYEILIWDPNQDTNDVLTVSKDFQTMTFASESYFYPRAYKILPVSNCGNTFDHLNIQNYLQYGEEANTMDTDMIMFDTTLLDYVLTADNGEYIQFINGVAVKGLLRYEINLEPLGNGDSGTQLILPASRSYTVTMSNDVASTFSMLIGDYYVEVDSAGLKELKITDNGQITTSSSEAAQQTISVTSGQLGDTWNSLTVSGSDTGFTLSAGKETVTVKSKNNVKATVVGGNVYSDKTSTQQTISVSSEGTTVSTSSNALTATESAAGDNPFTDVASNAYYYDAVLWAVKNSVTAGTSATTFSPNEPCNRAQIVTFLWRAAGCPEPASKNNPFADVVSNAYYYKAVLWAVENDITKGTSATTFGPSATCTRSQAVTFLWRAAGSPEPASNNNPFTDVASSAYYYKAVLWAVENDITKGTSATTFGPNATCNRAQIVTFLYRTYTD